MQRGRARPEPLPSRRAHWRRDGTAKTRFTTSTEAERAAVDARIHHGSHLVSYRCELCGGWHLGSLG